MDGRAVWPRFDAWAVGAWRSDALRPDWVALVRALHEASRPGGPLDGWLFHGTTEAMAASIAEDGMRTTSVEMHDPDTDQWWEASGTYWATAVIAALYAEDRAHGIEDSTLPLAIVAVRREDLELEGELAADLGSIEWPLASWTGRDDDAVRDEWQASGRTADDCLGLVGTLVCLGPVGPDPLVVLRRAADMDRLLAISAQPGPAA